ncbi:Tripartite ATP-independent periplasmic transporters, DctQ component [Falsiruegeria litorea R37]|uniref:TRAP transporter small permease protein n=1 Tax=Falsiruegeria litorea R37 TaxID=1200284 RepID=A0A1Y5TZ81_9RHOB|nr:TRAP transporter small permease [Falsiruegeria litorea]SLN72279.1 Tripartite ATP-independent periplasmic transporters, DctQ component [Falsiruegeria litorea R37]
MTKDILHTDSLDDILAPSPIIPVPAPEDRDQPVYRGLGGLYSIEAKVAWLMRVVMFVAMIALGLVMASQVFMRYVISSPFLGIEEMAPMMALWIYFIGMAYCTRERDHIEGGVMSLVFKKRTTLLAFRLFGSIACLVALVVFAKFAWDFASFNLSLNRKSSYMKLPKYMWDFSMIFGFALTIFYMLLQIFLEARALMTGKGGE